MKTPPITLAQISSYLLLGAGVALQHYGWMSTDVFFGVAAVAGVHIGSDAGLRAARTGIVKARTNYQAALVQAPPTPGDVPPAGA